MNLELAEYCDKSKWRPKPGDIVICNGFFTDWYGVVNGFNEKTNDVFIMKASTLQYILYMGTEGKSEKITKKMNLYKIINNGKMTIITGRMTWMI